MLETKGHTGHWQKYQRPGRILTMPNASYASLENGVRAQERSEQLGDRTYKVHLDGYNQLDLITGKGPSKRREIIYFAEGTLGAVRLGDYKYRFIDQPGGWLGGTVKPDFQLLTNLRLDPMERTVLTGSQAYLDWMKYAFWRLVFVQNVAAEFAETFLEFPPMQKPATFNLTAVIGQVRGRPGALTPSGRSKG